REPHRERRAGFRRLAALKADLALVLLHDALGDGKPQSRAGRSGLHPGFPPEEALEDVRLLLLRDARPGVADREAHPELTSRLAGVRRNADFAARRCVV